VPLYEYRCKQCGHQFEKIQSFSAPEEKVCPVCQGPVERLISAPAIQFKGSGWYVNDYAAKKSGPSKPSADGAKSGDGSGSASASGKSAGSSSESNSSSGTTSSPAKTE